ncbi:MAG: 3-deoxy-manno-octulosonate cytidylyltransferase [Bacteroidales bacterium]|jgi:3-deoxy-manno-octulosonate cytidylyltransferase (CMP-KDO synthetase)|nr:3-deoxy-manno-octulosonate cytidylyltransferase [Bacteroidales bacterium]
MKFIGIIPARYASTRFPGKPLVKIGDNSMIELVYNQAVKAFDKVLVATDDNRIADEVKRFGGNVVMTSADHQSGTDRCCEAAIKAFDSGELFDVVVNIQGDEPFIQPEQLGLLKDCFNDRDTEIATLIKKIESTDDLFDENKPKVITRTDKSAIYFSRWPIPFIRGCEKDEWFDKHTFYKHIGLYAYRFNTLKDICKLKPSAIEKAESLEQNRWIENGFTIKTAVTTIETIGIDTPDDLKKVIQ